MAPNSTLLDSPAAAIGGDDLLALASGPDLMASARLASDTKSLDAMAVLGGINLSPSPDGVAGAGFGSTSGFAPHPATSAEPEPVKEDPWALINQCGVVNLGKLSEPSGGAPSQAGGKSAANVPMSAMKRTSAPIASQSAGTTNISNMASSFGGMSVGATAATSTPAAGLNPSVGGGMMGGMPMGGGMGSTLAPPYHHSDDCTAMHRAFTTLSHAVRYSHPQRLAQACPLAQRCRWVAWVHRWRPWAVPWEAAWVAP